MSTTHDLFSAPERVTQRELATALGVKPNVITAWKRRGYVPRKHHRRIAEVFGRPELVAELATEEAAAMSERLAAKESARGA